MNYFIINDIEVEKKFRELFAKHGLKNAKVNSLEELYTQCLEKTPRSVILAYESISSLELFDTVRDLRIMFGSVLTISILGKNTSDSEVAHILGMGADHFFPLPLDQSLFEESLRRNLFQDICLPFKYRSVPSGGSLVKTKSQIELTELSKSGVKFFSNSFFTKGFVFEMDMTEQLKIPIYNQKVKIIQNQKSDGDYFFEYVGEFEGLDDQAQKKINHGIEMLRKGSRG